MKTAHHGARAFLSDARIWKLCAVYFCQIIGLYGISFWLPSIIKDSGLTDVSVIGWLSAIPYLVAIPAIIVTGMSADRFRSRRMHFSIALLIGAADFAASGYVGQQPASPSLIHRRIVVGKSRHDRLSIRTAAGRGRR